MRLDAAQRENGSQAVRQTLTSRSVCSRFLKGPSPPGPRLRLACLSTVAGMPLASRETPSRKACRGRFTVIPARGSSPSLAPCPSTCCGAHWNALPAESGARALSRRAAVELSAGPACGSQAPPSGPPDMEAAHRTPSGHTAASHRRRRRREREGGGVRRAIPWEDFPQSRKRCLCPSPFPPGALPMTGTRGMRRNMQGAGESPLRFPVSPACRSVEETHRTASPCPDTAMLSDESPRQNDMLGTRGIAKAIRLRPACFGASPLSRSSGERRGGREKGKDNVCEIAGSLPTEWRDALLPPPSLASSSSCGWRPCGLRACDAPPPCPAVRMGVPGCRRLAPRSAQQQRAATAHAPRSLRGARSSGRRSRCWDMGQGRGCFREPELR